LLPKLKNMALVKPVNGVYPKVGACCYLAKNATVAGDVVMGDQCIVWFNALVRGDVHYIRMGNKVNVQDNATIHARFEKHPTTIGNNVSIGHNAIVHVCTIGDNVLIGMGAIVMDACVVQSNSLIAAGAVLLKGTHVTSGSVYAGVPAKKVKETTPELLHGQIDRIANAYIKYAGWYKNPAEGDKI
jgi:carbonic anhydrase/acetyltransferase-like protein (isoleucine patch superfamily)